MIRCGVEPSQNLELIVCPGDPISGNRTSNFRFSISRTSKFSEARKVVGKTRKKVTSYEGKGSLLYEGPYHVVRKMVLVFSLTEAGEQQIGWVFGKYQATMGAVGKARHLPNFHAKIDSTITIYFGHSFTKVTTFIIIINYKNCYLGKSIWEGSLV